MIQHPLVEDALHEYDHAVRTQEWNERNRRDDARRIQSARMALEEARDTVRGRGAVELDNDHLTLLRAANWRWNDAMPPGALTQDAKRPYGNSDVEDDLARLLPHLDDAQRLRVHRELPLVIGTALTALATGIPA